MIFLTTVYFNLLNQCTITTYQIRIVIYNFISEININSKL